MPTPRIALLPILVVAVFMVELMRPSSKARPMSLLSVAMIALTFWEMPWQHLTTRSLAGIINALNFWIS
ncbi:MAG TPA: hypothetical protein ENN39_04200 [Desulfonatronum sp.]|nr:hypothetical protein [Desulfonatronum sp.]